MHLGKWGDTYRQEGSLMYEVSHHLSSLELLRRMVGENVSGQLVKKCHNILFIFV